MDAVPDGLSFAVVKPANIMQMTNEEIIRTLYQAAETDVNQFVAMFTPDGYAWDVSSGNKYTGERVSIMVTGFSDAFPDVHRAIDQIYVAGDVVIVELFINGTHTGPLALAGGTIPPTGKPAHIPCCDVFHLENGKVKSFHCHNSGITVLGQIGVLGNLTAAMEQHN